MDAELKSIMIEPRATIPPPPRPWLAPSAVPASPRIWSIGLRLKWNGKRSGTSTVETLRNIEVQFPSRWSNIMENRPLSTLVGPQAMINNIWPLAITAALVMNIAAHAAFAGGAWETVDAGYFRMSVPAGLYEKRIQPIDSYIRIFTNSTMTLQLDFGWYSDRLRRPGLQDRPDYQEEHLVIDGRQAFIVRAPNHEKEGQLKNLIAMHIPDVGDGNNRLTIHCYCVTTNHFQIAERIFRSVQFTDKRGPSKRSNMPPGAILPGGN